MRPANEAGGIMFVDQVRRALEVSPRAELGQLSEALWKGYAAGAIGEDEAQQLAEEIQARKTVPTPPRSAPRRIGSRPATSESMERRRRWSASGRMPPAMAARFTMAEQAVLALVAAEVTKRGDCRLTVGHLAAIAGVSATTVRNALRAAASAGHLTIEERRVTYWRNLPNVVRIVAPDWTAWLRLRGGQSAQPTGTMRTNVQGRAPMGVGAIWCSPRIQVQENLSSPKETAAKGRPEKKGMRPMHHD